MPVTLSSNSLFAQALDCARTMLADSATWRALVAQPDTDWTTLAALIAAGTSSQSNALARIRLGQLEDDAEHDDYVAPPRICLRHPDTSDIERLSTTGFLSTLQLIVTCEFPIPTGYRASFQDAYADFLNKIGGLVTDLKRLPRGAGYLDIARIQLGESGLIDPDQNNGERWAGGELLIECRGT